MTSRSVTVDDADLLIDFTRFRQKMSAPAEGWTARHRVSSFLVPFLSSLLSPSYCLSGLNNRGVPTLSSWIQKT